MDVSAGLDVPQYSEKQYVLRSKISNGAGDSRRNGRIGRDFFQSSTGGRRESQETNLLPFLKKSFSGSASANCSVDSLEYASPPSITPTSSSDFCPHILDHIHDECITRQRRLNAFEKEAHEAQVVKGGKIRCTRRGCQGTLANRQALMAHLHIHDIANDILAICSRCKEVYNILSTDHTCSEKHNLHSRRCKKFLGGLASKLRLCVSST